MLLSFPAISLDCPSSLVSFSVRFLSQSLGTLSAFRRLLFPHLALLPLCFGLAPDEGTPVRSVVIG